MQNSQSSAPVYTASVVILDLDNTLYDWFATWYGGFAPMLSEIERISRVPIATLKEEIQKIFRAHGTSEYSFLLQELTCVHQAGETQQSLLERFASAIRAYRIGRRAELRLYDGVWETLRAARSAGVLVVAFTESQAFYTVSRLRALQLDGIIDILYTPEDHDVPEMVDLSAIRTKPPDAYRLLATEHRRLAFGTKKPDASILRRIVEDVGAKLPDVVYVGDSITKDIAMARAAGVLDVHAAYGAKLDPVKYGLLQQVSHWTDQEIEDDKRIRSEWEANPTKGITITLARSLSELLGSVRFTKYQGDSRLISRADAGISLANLHALAPDELNPLVDAWKATIDVQKHFNDLELRIRNYAIGILSALIAAAAIVSKDRGFDSVLLAKIALGGLASWLMFYGMDRFWYHRLLMGAVNHGRKLEKGLRIRLGHDGFALTESIGRESPISVLGLSIHSSTKMDLFYGIGAALILASALAFYLQGGTGPNAATPDTKPPASTTSQRTFRSGHSGTAVETSQGAGSKAERSSISGPHPGKVAPIATSQGEGGVSPSALLKDAGGRLSPAP